jgi:nucleotide-binding universal stress UspA family protein
MKRELTIKRILVALDASPHSLAALEAAAELATALHAELLGLFIEDANLLRLAELPFMREIGSFTGLARPLARHELELQLQAQARLARRALAAVAGRAQLQWSFQIRRGMVAAELLRASLDADLISLGTFSGSFGSYQRLGSTALAVFARATSPILVLRRGMRLGSPVLVVFDGTAAAETALALASQLTGGEHLLVLIPAGSPIDPARLKAAAEGQLEAAGVRAAHYLTFAAASGESLSQHLRDERAGLLILPNSSPLLARGDWLAGLPCPLILVR